MERLPNEEEKERMRELVAKVAAYFDKHNKPGQFVTPADLTKAVEADSIREVGTAVTICRMNGLLILENSQGLFVAKNREAYDLWFRMYLQPTMQTMLSVARGMKAAAEKLPRILRPRAQVKVKGNGNGKAKG